MFKNNSIIITSNTAKKDILCSNNNKLTYYKIYTLLWNQTTVIL